MQKGKIAVTSENIFPIIKKFLYSDHEIFLRELVSNAVDATQKLKTLASVGEFKGELGDLTIRVAVDKNNKTITISDRGIGMTGEEIDKYINQIAFSSAEEFLEKYKNDLNAIIGHFGLGFYSSFMVSERVEIKTLSHKESAKAVKWECNGSPDYQLEETSKDSRGTDIVLHIAADSEEFLEESRIEGILKKYCRFLPVEIAFGKEKEWKDEKYVESDKDRIINETKPAWTKKPADLKEEDYKQFYHDLYPVAEEPMFNIHLNVDYPFNLTGILYFPKIKSNFEIQKNKIQLYSNQVFVTDSVEGIVPEFLTLLHGVLDSPDIPLNVSRSYLQSDSNVKKISGHITKKVADRLEEIFKTQREDYEKKWDDLKLFIQYGMISDEKFFEKIRKIALFKNTEDKYFTIEEYETLVKANQTDKNGRLIYLYATNKTDQFAYIQDAKNKGYDVLILDGQLDQHYINHLESKLEKTGFVRVDSEIADKLIVKEDTNDSKLSWDEQMELGAIFQDHLPKENHFSVLFENRSESDQPMTITQSEFMRRMRDMGSLSGMSFYNNLPASFNLVVNLNHPVVKNLMAEKDQKLGNDLVNIQSEIKATEMELTSLNDSLKNKKEEEISQSEKDQKENLNKSVSELKDRKRELYKSFGSDNKIAKQLIDLALISNNMLKGESLMNFVHRSIDLLHK